MSEEPTTPKWYQSEEEQLLAGNPTFDPKERLSMIRKILGKPLNYDEFKEKYKHCIEDIENSEP